MTDKEKQELEARRKESALKTMYYTRYFSVRYATAAFFFVNLYWTLMLYLSNARLAMMLPMAVALFAALAMWEQTRMYTREAKLTKLFYGISLSLNVLLILLVLLNRFSLLYPFFTARSATQVFLIMILLVGILLNLLMLAKLNRISHRADKQYQRIQKYMASLQ